MRQIFSILTTLLLATAVCAQQRFAVVNSDLSPKEELKHNLQLSGGLLAAYPGPLQHRLTPPPQGKRPFMLSHYGRHGSRYQNKLVDYDYLYEILSKANRYGKLTQLGSDVAERVELVRQDAADRLGEITSIGLQQQREITQRMTERFPELFRGQQQVTMHSTTLMRCAMSMTSAMVQLLLYNPRLQISFDASHRNMYYLRPNERSLTQQTLNDRLADVYNDFKRKRQCWQHPVHLLFNDSAYVRDSIDGEELGDRLFRMASFVQNTELGRKITFYDLFTDSEILAFWEINNVSWYFGYGHNPLNGGTQPLKAKRLLNRILIEADSCIALPHPTVTLRYGHDTTLMPLVALIGLNGTDVATDNPAHVDRHGWIDYRIAPMAGNLQIVFYRHNPADRDILVKFLLNENEAVIPIKSDIAPYYRWTEVKEYLETKLNRLQAEDSATK